MPRIEDPIRGGISVDLNRQLDLAAARLDSYHSAGAWIGADIGRGINHNLETSWLAMRRGGGTAFEGLLVDARMGWQIDPRQCVRLALQSNHIDRWGRTDDRGLAAQLLYSWRLDSRTALHASTSLGPTTTMIKARCSMAPQPVLEDQLRLAAAVLAAHAQIITCIINIVTIGAVDSYLVANLHSDRARREWKSLCLECSCISAVNLFWQLVV